MADEPPATALAEHVRNILTGAGYEHAAEGGGVDGFEVHRPTSGPDTCAIVTLRFEGRLRDLGLPGVRRHWMAGVCAALTSAGLAIDVHKVDQVPVWVTAAREERAIKNATILDDAGQGGPVG